MTGTLGGYEPTYRGQDVSADYRGAHVLTASGQLGEIMAVTYRRESRGMRGYIATLRHFNGERMDSCPLSMLRILPRNYPTTGE